MSTTYKAANGRGGKPKPPKQQAPPAKPSDAAPAKQMIGFNLSNDRLVFGGTVSIGHRVEVHVCFRTLFTHNLARIDPIPPLFRIGEEWDCIRGHLPHSTD
jgi:hypothetical protein